jgi:hypothetical protein
MQWTEFCVHNTMSFKGCSYLLPKAKTVYTEEHEEADWSVISENLPIMSMGCGAFSEQGFGLYHVGHGRLSRVSLNAYPVQPQDWLNVIIRAITQDGTTRDLCNLEFNGSMQSIQLNCILPSDHTQLVVIHMGNSYDVGVVRVRMYIEISEI